MLTRQDVSISKVAVAETYQRIADRAVQVFGTMGGGADTPIADAFAWARALRIFDGPDEVHWFVVGRAELAHWSEDGARDYNPKEAFTSQKMLSGS